MNGAASSLPFLENLTSRNGHVSILTQSDYNRGTKEVDRAWIKTVSYTASHAFTGVEIGFDFYVNRSKLWNSYRSFSRSSTGHTRESEIAYD